MKLKRIKPSFCCICSRPIKIKGVGKHVCGYCKEAYEVGYKRGFQKSTDTHTKKINKLIDKLETKLGCEEVKDGKNKKQ